MYNPQHTPGPWKAHFEEAYFVTGPDLGRVAMMMNLKGAYGLGGRRSGDESAANARLIAAAPDLLEALVEERRIRLLGQQPDVHWESLRDCRRACYAITDAAIASATGSTHE